jgi:organic radical activating enzyme
MSFQDISKARETSSLMEKAKFQDPLRTANNEERAFVPLQGLKTLWFNTGTRCNLSCENCYIESNPKNDRLSFLTGEEVQAYLDEVAEKNYPVQELGLTGGEPFLNPHIEDIIQRCLQSGKKTLVLTNAFRIERYKEKLQAWNREFPGQLTIRVSLDHYTEQGHEEERGKGTFAPTLQNIKWMADQGVAFAVAGRSLADEPTDEIPAQYAQALQSHGIRVDPDDPQSLVVFAEMDRQKDVPEITTACWVILNKAPSDVMCSNSRMVVKRKGAAHPVVLACTLIAYETEFELGQTLEEAHKKVYLNHPFCAQFCVLGGSSCS